MRERMRLREEMHQKLRESMLRGTDPRGAMRDMEKLMDSMMEDMEMDMGQLDFGMPSLGGSHALSFGTRQHFSTEWTETSTGRSLVVRPASKDIKLDVQVKGQVVSISTDYAQKTKGTSVQGQSVQTQIVPPDCDGDQVKMEAKSEGLVLFFPFKGKSPGKDEGRTPIQGKASDIQT